MKTTNDVARELGNHRRTIQGWCARLALPKMGRDWLLDDEQVELIKSNVHARCGRPRKGQV